MTSQGFSKDLQEPLLPIEDSWQAASLERKDGSSQNSKWEQKGNSCFPIPPIPEDEMAHTVYSAWKESCNCIPEEMLINWQQDSSIDTQCTSYTCYCGMALPYCIDRATYQICCCGDSRNCNCQVNTCNCCLECCCALCTPNILKFPFGILAGINACFGSLAGSFCEWVCGSKPSEQITVEQDKQKSHATQSWRLNTLNKNQAYSILHQHFQKAELIQILAFKNDPLWGRYMLRFFVESKLGLGLIGLILRYEKEEEVPLESRKILITNLIRLGIPIEGISIPNYQNERDHFSLPIFEAFLSKYQFAPELIQFLCEVNPGIKNSKVLIFTEKGWELVTLCRWAYLYYSTISYGEEREIFYRKLACFRNVNADEKNEKLDFDRFFVAKEEVLRKIGLSVGLSAIVEEYSCEFFKRAPMPNQEIKADLLKEKTERFFVLPEPKLDLAGHRELPKEYFESLPYRPRTPSPTWEDPYRI